MEQVESGQFSGVCWEDTEKTMFRIPWKHAGKQDFREDQDAAFFKAWAIFKGKYKEGGTEGPAAWKTRLRCALNKSPEFEEVPERGRMDGTEPYKVYRLLPQGTLPARPETQKSPLKRHHSSVSSEREDEGTKKKCILSPSLLQDPPQRGEVKADEGADCSDCGGGSSTYGSSSSSNNSPEPQRGADTTEASLQRDQACLDLLLLPDSVTCISPSPAPASTDPQADQDEYWEDMLVRSSADFSLLLTFIYNGHVVGEAQVQSLDCRLVAEPLDSQHGMEQVVFPKPGPQEATQRLLNQLNRGVLVASNSQGLFVQRLCSIPISWNAPQTPSGPGPHLLPSNKCVKLFRTACFCRDLVRFSHGLGPAPKYQVTLNFWEESPGPSHTHENSLITVQMEQAFARHLLKTTEEQAATLSLVQGLEDPPPSPSLLPLSSLNETVYIPCLPASLGENAPCCL